MAFEPKFLATGIGSMPFDDPGHAVDVSLSRLSQAPFWPQLPKLGLNEQMEIQYSEGLPCAVIDTQKQRLYFNTDGDNSEELAQFYETYMAVMDPDEGSGNCESMAISPQFAKGLHAFYGRLKDDKVNRQFIKVQTTGPCSFSLTIVDGQKRAIYYNEEFRDMIVKALAMKCRWQIQKFKPFASQIICFIDEPILSAFGSSTYVSVQRDDVVALLTEVADSIHVEGALAGVHCCGNTEWSILIEAGIDIINFDAYTYGETIAMYPDEVKGLLENGGALAWGIVPTSTAVRNETAESLAERLEKLMDNLASGGIDKKLIVRQSVLTPSCGTGSLDPADAERVFDLLQALSVSMKGKYGF
jgi:hypothetical protein